MNITQAQAIQYVFEPVLCVINSRVLWLSRHQCIVQTANVQELVRSTSGFPCDGIAVSILPAPYSHTVVVLVF
jgi:hypothetical protein